MSVRQILTSKRLVAAAAVPAAVLASGAMVFGASYSAFSATTVNPTNNWDAGTVVLADDDANTALFTAQNLKPGASGTKCIVVSSTGTLASTVKLYGTGYSAPNANGASLASNITLKVEEGTGGTNADCTGFAPIAGAAAFDGTLAGFASKTNFDNGIGTWAPAGASTAAPVKRTYKVSYKLADNTPNAAQGGAASVGLTWEAQNS